MKSITFLSLAALLLVQDPQPPVIGEQHYRIYRGDGSAATLDHLVAASRAAVVTFLGESHDDPVAHYLVDYAQPQVLTKVNADGSYESRPARRPILIRDLLAQTSGISYSFLNPALTRLSETGTAELKLPLLHDPGAAGHTDLVQPFWAAS